MSQSPVDHRRLALIGVPSSAGARQTGQELAPESLRAAGLVERLRGTGYDVMDLGDLARVSFAPDDEHPTRQNLRQVLGVVREVARGVDLAIRNRAKPLVIGGDCTVTIGVLAALAERLSGLGLMYFDGDVDLNTPDTTRSGILDGMVLAHILGRGAPELRAWGSRHPLVEEPNVTLFGYGVQSGGIDPVEVELLATTPMAKYPLEDIRRDGVGRAAARAIRELEARAEHIVVHFDVDVLDADEFPAVDVPHQPGLGLAEAQAALDEFMRSRKVVALVVTEFNAARDRDGILAAALNQMIRRAMAQSTRSVTGVEPGSSDAVRPLDRVP